MAILSNQLHCIVSPIAHRVFDVVLCEEVANRVPHEYPNMKLPILIFFTTAGVSLAETCPGGDKTYYEGDCLVEWCYDDAGKWYSKKDCPKSRKDSKMISKDQSFDDPYDKDCEWKVRWVSGKGCWKWKECDGKWVEGEKKQIEDTYCEKESKSSDECYYVDSDDYRIDSSSEDDCKGDCRYRCDYKNKGSYCEDKCYSRCKRDHDCYDLDDFDDDDDDDDCWYLKKSCCKCWDRCVKKKGNRTTEKKCIRKQCKGKVSLFCCYMYWHISYLCFTSRQTQLTYLLFTYSPPPPNHHSLIP